MLARLEPLILQLEGSGALVTAAIEDLTPEAWETRLGDGAANHAAFITLHLLDARCFILRTLGEDVHHAFEERTRPAKRLEDIAEYPGPRAILEAWHDVGRRFRPALEAVTDEWLDEVAAHPFPIDDETRLGLLAFLVQHETYHLGQLGLIRAALGFPSLFGRTG